LLGALRLLGVRAVFARDDLAFAVLRLAVPGDREAVLVDFRGLVRARVAAGAVRAVVLRAVALRAVVLRPVVFRAVVLGTVALRVPVFRAVLAPPFRPPFRADAVLVFLPRPEPASLPPPVSLFTVAQARRAASFPPTPRFS